MVRVRMTTAVMSVTVRVRRRVKIRRKGEARRKSDGTKVIIVGRRQ